MLIRKARGKTQEEQTQYLIKMISNEERKELIIVTRNEGKDLIVVMSGEEETDRRGRHDT